MTIAEIKVRRTELSLTQQQLAVAAGLEDSTISTTETGKYVPRKKTLESIGKALDEAEQRILHKHGEILSNGDAIRKMDDEELVFIITCQKQNCRISPADRDCYQCKLTWLREKYSGLKSPQ